ncbi:ankyrin repeat domain-containing protein [Luteimonas sp. SDU101]|uniref:ankyrin repeat domain-containing protein n=1 Tax=Luteimonas sp. SDU101 TaxID=3422593 RepID=UPI003EB842C0
MSTPTPKDLYYAAGTDDVDLCRELLARGADVNGRMEEGGGTALHATARSGAVKTARFLIDNGADVNAQDNGGMTPLHHSAVHLQSEVCRELLNSGADPTVRSTMGHTASKMSEVAFNFISEGREIKTMIQSAERKHALCAIAAQARPSDELARPEEALQARKAKYGRAM